MHNAMPRVTLLLLSAMLRYFPVSMTTAMYLYATMIYITDMESGEHVCMYPCDDDSDIRSSMVAEPNL